MANTLGKMVLTGLLAAMLLATACVRTQHEVDVKPIEVKPIHITIDVNIKIDKALDDFFGDIDQAEQEITSTETPSPEKE